MKEDVRANQENYFKVLTFLAYTLEKLRYLRFLHSNYIREKIQSFKKGGFFCLHFEEIITKKK